MAGLTKQRVFIHYVLGKMVLLFFLCHPGTLATCDGQAYLRNRYANRDVVTTESEQNDHRRHYKPRDASEFTMKIGVPDEILHGDVDSYTPDWALSLEERFHNTVKAWLRKGSALAVKQRAAAAAEAAAAAAGHVISPSGMAKAFVPSLTPRAGATLVPQRNVNDRLRRRGMLPLDDVGPSPLTAAAAAVWNRNSRLPARTRRIGGCGCCGARGTRGNGGGGGDTTMLLGRFRRGGFPLRRASGEGEAKVDGSSGASNDGAGLEVEMEAAAAEAAHGKNAARFEDEALEAAPATSIFSSFLGGAADAYDNAVSFVGSTLIRSEIGKKYMNGYDSGPTSIRRTGGGPADMNTGSTYDLVGFSNIDPFEASGRRGGGASHRL